jgi:hypothetical protein
MAAADIVVVVVMMDPPSSSEIPPLTTCPQILPVVPIIERIQKVFVWKNPGNEWSFVLLVAIAGQRGW